MFRFITLMWDGADRAAQAAALRMGERLRDAGSSWECSLESPTMRIWSTGCQASPSRAIVCQGELGVVLGVLFSRGATERLPSHPTAWRVERMSADEEARIFETRGRRLVDEYWGRYVAFGVDRSRGRRWVLRDPSGALPCWSAQAQGVRLFFSRLADYASVIDEAPSICWPHVAGMLCDPFVSRCQTGLWQVAEVQPGEAWCVERDGTSTAQRYWNPFSIASEARAEDSTDLLARLRATVQQCVWAWAAQYRQVLHLLSGDLDSAIVLACLTEAPSRPVVRCMTYFHRQFREMDERVLARVAARANGCELVECEESAADLKLTQLLELETRCRPTLHPLLGLRGSRETQLAAQYDASATLSGGGGEQIFFQGPVALAVADCVYQCGLSRTWLHFAYRVAGAQQLSLWSVLSDSLRERFFSPAFEFSPWVGRHVRLASSDVVDAVRGNADRRSAMLEDVRAIAPAKRLQVLGVAAPFEVHDPACGLDSPERVYPLLSQPLVELCLRIPTYRLAEQGRGRGLARAAFARQLPREIASRRAKATANRYLGDLLRTHVAFVRETLMEGRLVREGLLDRKAVERVLTRRQCDHGEEAEIMGRHLPVELWSRAVEAGR
jgi:asparagine synthase (glutamine-hydrolysing)